MDHRQNRHVLFVVNPISGGKNKTEFLASLPEFAKQYSFTLFQTTGKDDREYLATVIKNEEPGLVCVAGGDGTCNLTASVLIATGIPIPMAIIPFGSANGLARDLNIPLDTGKALDMAFNGEVRPIDCLVINGHLCLHLADIGFNAKVIHRFQQSRTRGMTEYARQFMKELFSSMPSPFVVKVNGHQVRVQAHMIALANTVSYASGAIINPNGNVNDGQFELCIIKHYSFRTLFRLFLDFFTGRLDKHKDVNILSCSEAQLLNLHRQMLQIDGESIGKLYEINISIKSSALLIRRP